MDVARFEIPSQYNNQSLVFFDQRGGWIMFDDGEWRDVFYPKKKEKRPIQLYCYFFRCSKRLTLPCLVWSTHPPFSIGNINHISLILVKREIDRSSCFFSLLTLL